MLYIVFFPVGTQKMKSFVDRGVEVLKAFLTRIDLHDPISFVGQSNLLPFIEDFLFNSFDVLKGQIEHEIFLA